MRRTLLAAAFASGVLGGAAAAAECRLALALALDVSSSVDASEYALQTEGLASALEAPEVRRAIFLDGAGPVALAIYEWSGRNEQALVQHWILLSDQATLDGVIARLRGTTRSHDQFPTALGYALAYGALLMRTAPNCARHTIDVSGDGMANEGYAPPLAYENFDFAGITVNGLVIGGSVKPELVSYYIAQVLHGPGAFVEVAADYTDYSRAMRRKLLRELMPPIFVSRRR
ncbi:MAG: DUF1194 domain-containing protein [Pseudomonadota bacterium]